MFNRPAKAIFDRKDGLILTRDGLAADRADETTALRRLIRGAIATASGKGMESGGVMSLSRPSLRRSLSVMVSPLRPDTLLPSQDRPAAAIFVSDPEAKIEPNDEVLRRLFGLTPAESKLAGVLMQGKSVEQLPRSWGPEAGLFARI